MILLCFWATVSAFVCLVCSSTVVRNYDDDDDECTREMLRRQRTAEKRDVRISGGVRGSGGVGVRGGAVAPGGHLQGRHFDQFEYFFIRLRDQPNGYLLIRMMRLFDHNKSINILSCLLGSLGSARDPI